MKKKEQTQATFVNDKQFAQLQGVTTIKDDSTQKHISVSLYDIDNAILWHLNNKIRPIITTNIGNQTKLQVPVVFTSMETWASIQKYGYLRDTQNQLICPIITLMRDSISKRDELIGLNVLNTQDNRVIFASKYSKTNQYTDTLFFNKVNNKDYYSMDIPRYITVSYKCNIWTETISQLNEVVEQIFMFNGTAFGETYKFVTEIGSPDFDITTSVGDNRIVRATMELTTNAYLLTGNNENMQVVEKLNPINKIIISIKET